MAGSVVPPFAGAVTVGQIDTFQDGTTENWFAGGGPFGAVPPVPPTNIPTGGPGGSTDRYLHIAATGGSGAGSRLTAINGTQWTGNYLTAGVNAISIDVNNLGTTDLSLRLL